MAKNKNTYNAEDIEVVELDVDKIKKRPDMYIGYSNTMGFKHLIKEVVQNSIDEYGGGYCTSINILYDEKSKTISIQDDGRGIPHGKLIACATILQSSGKFSKGKDRSYRFAAGKNGVGLKCANALSEECLIVSQRDGEEYRCQFENGYLVNEEKISCKSKSTGTLVKFRPNEKILGKIDLTPEGLMDLCDTLSYLSSAKIVVDIITKKGSKMISTTYHHKLGIVDLLNDIVKRPLLKEPIRLTGAFNGDENNGTYDKTIDVIFTYVTDINDMNIETKSNNLIISFANYCTTVDGGTHVEGFKKGLMKAFPKFIRDNILTKKDKELNINLDDIMDGLVAIVNLNHQDASFIGQVKEKLGNEDCVDFVRDVVAKELNAWFKNNGSESVKLGKYIRDVAKVRAKANADKKAVVKNNIDVTNIFTGKPKGFEPATGTEDLELWIVEGDSAAGSMVQGRDKTYQAIYKLKGVTLNTLDAPINKLLENDEIRGLIEVLGCNIGKKFNPDKCRYKRVFISTDADESLSA